MNNDGFRFGVTENEVWCTEEVPVKYISDRIYEK
nr:MAG TPA: RNA 2'-phosphotransferase [Bacteriophage sp.]